MIDQIVWTLEQMLDSSKLKAFADNLKFDENGRNFSKQVFWKHCVKRRNCSLRAISPFPTVFSKDLYCRYVKNQGFSDKGLSVFKIISFIPRQSVQLSMLSWCSFYRYLHYILFKPLAAFPHIYHRSYGQQRERNQSTPSHWQSRGSNQWPDVLKSFKLPSELLRLGSYFHRKHEVFCCPCIMVYIASTENFTILWYF